MDEQLYEDESLEMDYTGLNRHQFEGDQYYQDLETGDSEEEDYQT